MATRANAEKLLVKRLSGYLVAAGMAVTFAGENEDLNDGLGWSLRQLGYTVADITSVASAEVASVTTANLDEFLDFAELRSLENIYGNLAFVDTKLGPRQESLSQLSKQVQARLAKLETKLAQKYGYNAPTLEAGVMEHNFAQHNETPASE